MRLAQKGMAAAKSMASASRVWRESWAVANMALTAKAIRVREMARARTAQRGWRNLSIESVDVLLCVSIYGLL